MMLRSDLEELDSRGSIIFLGSGFARLAKNITGGFLPTGHELREEFAKRLHVNPDDYDLKTLADEVAASSDLYQMLYNLFTVQEVQEDQIGILKLPWLRIYTTNYDDAIEFLPFERGH